MEAATVQEGEGAPRKESAELLADPRWQLVERIARSEPFQKSARLPKLLLYLARQTITGDRHKLTEQAIGNAVFGKREHYNPAADSGVRVYVRQLRLRLHEYYHSIGVNEQLIVSVPKGGYALDFSPSAIVEPQKQQTTPAEPVSEKPSRAVAARPVMLLGLLSAALLIVASVCAMGWYRASHVRAAVAPWPLNSVLHKGNSTTLILADAGFALRMLGNKEVPLDSYIAHSYLEPLLPKHMSENESIVLHYFDSTRITSEADAEAAAGLSYLAAPYTDGLQIRSAKDINAEDLTHGDFIFIGSKTSNPWVELLDSRMNFQVVENGPHGARYIANRHPRAGEQSIYSSPSMGTLASGEDFAVIAVLPAKTGKGSMLLLEGVRMEGTKAAIALLQNPAARARLQQTLSAANGGQPPQYFEALLHAQSVAGATISVDAVATRVLK